MDKQNRIFSVHSSLDENIKEILPRFFFKMKSCYFISPTELFQSIRLFKNLCFVCRQFVVCQLTRRFYIESCNGILADMIRLDDWRASIRFLRCSKISGKAESAEEAGAARNGYSLHFPPILDLCLVPRLLLSPAPACWLALPAFSVATRLQTELFDGACG